METISELNSASYDI